MDVVSRVEQRGSLSRSAATGSPGLQGVVMVSASGPFGLAEAISMARGIDAAHGRPHVVIVDLTTAVLTMPAVAALQLCDRATGIDALRAAVGVIAPWAPPGACARLAFDAARLGLTRRVFADERQAIAWARRWMAAIRA